MSMQRNIPSSASHHSRPSRWNWDDLLAHWDKDAREARLAESQAHQGPTGFERLRPTEALQTMWGLKSCPDYIPATLRLAPAAAPSHGTTPARIGPIPVTPAQFDWLDRFVQAPTSARRKEMVVAGLDATGGRIEVHGFFHVASKANPLDKPDESVIMRGLGPKVVPMHLVFTCGEASLSAVCMVFALA